MKKLLFTTSIIALLFAGCSKDDDGGGKSCADRAEDVSAAFGAYFEDETTENCEAYRSAVQAYIDSDCPGESTYEAMLEGLDCSNP